PAAETAPAPATPLWPALAAEAASALTCAPAGPERAERRSRAARGGGCRILSSVGRARARVKGSRSSGARQKLAISFIDSSAGVCYNIVGVKLHERISGALSRRVTVLVIPQTRLRPWRWEVSTGFFLFMVGLWTGLTI